MPERVLALFAKAPVAGQVKTRLTPPLSPEQAAAFYEAMLLDILDQCAARPAPGARREASVGRRALWYTPEAASDWFRRHAPPGYDLYPQRGPDLGTRMAALFETHAGEGLDRIVLRGTDSPTLPRERVDEAFVALDRADLVLCPDRDGGYNLIGLRAPCASLFEFEMSTISVLGQTLARAAVAGLTHVLLEPHHDVDVVADLESLRADAGEDTPRTLRWLRAHPPPSLVGDVR